jgi:glycosyltransferase involved in cell wall biosynthesis
MPSAAQVTVAILALARQQNGGTLPYSLSMIEALRLLAPDRYRCVVYTPEDNHEYDAAGLPIVRLPRSVRMLARALRGELFGDSTIVVAPIYSLWLLAARQPFVFTLHDLQERYLPDNFSLPVRVWRRVINTLLTRSAEAIVCESAYVRDDIVKFFGVDARKIAVIPAPPLALSPVEPRGDGGPIVSADLPKRYVFYPAQFWPHKNHIRLVEAFALVASQFPDCVLVLTGEKRDQYAAVFKRVAELGLRSRVQHVGHVGRARLTELYRNATVVAIPTLFESISLPVYEAFANGAPVCASNILALPQQVGDAGLLFDPQSAEDIARQIGALLTDGALRARLIERGRQRVTAVTQEQYSRRLGQVIDGALQRSLRG